MEGKKQQLPTSFKCFTPKKPENEKIFPELSRFDDKAAK